MSGFNAGNGLIESARMAVETRYWPLYEVIEGTYTMTYKPRERVPIADWLLSQGRFRHLKRPEHKHLIDELQAQVDEHWDWLLEQEARAVD